MHAPAPLTRSRAGYAEVEVRLLVCGAQHNADQITLQVPYAGMSNCY